MLTQYRIGEILAHANLPESLAAYEAVARAAEESHAQCVETLAGVAVGVFLDFISPRERVRLLQQYCFDCGCKRPCKCQEAKNAVI